MISKLYWIIIMQMD